jgi:hypothetical protein
MHLLLYLPVFCPIANIQWNYLNVKMDENRIRAQYRIIKLINRGKRNRTVRKQLNTSVLLLLILHQLAT